MFCGNRDETVIDMKSECSKLAQKEYKAKYDWVGKVINWELCKRLKFNQNIKSYMRKPESTKENTTHNILWNFEMQTDHRQKTKQSID